ncbi:MAG: hypothetical protein ACYC8T_22220 [Myxococcaceae bacterium]
MNRPLRTALFAALSLCLALAAPGCKKPKPSPEYASAQALFGTVYGEQLDDAYVDPRMAEVEALLATVPADSLDHKSATELQAKIASERARVTADNAARQQAIADALKPVEMKFDERPSAPADAPTEAAPEVPDAGPPTQPMSGMATAEFLRLFSGCFTQGPTIELTGHGMCETYELKDITNCRDRHPGFLTALLVLGEGKILSVVSKSQLKTKLVLPDGGLADAGS